MDTNGEYIADISSKLETSQYSLSAEYYDT